MHPIYYDYGIFKRKKINANPLAIGARIFWGYLKCHTAAKTSPPRSKLQELNLCRIDIRFLVLLQLLKQAWVTNKLAKDGSRCHSLALNDCDLLKNIISLVTCVTVTSNVCVARGIRKGVENILGPHMSRGRTKVINCVQDSASPGTFWVWVTGLF